MENSEVTSRAVILSAGKGSRLLPLTLERPKCLVKVAGKAILDHQIDALELAGMDKIYVVTGYRSEMVEAHLAGSSRRATIIYNPDWNNSSSIKSVYAAREMLHGNFMLLNGDTIYGGNMLRAANNRSKPGLNLLTEKIDAAQEDDMLVTSENGQISDVSKKLNHTNATHRSLGVIIGHSAGPHYTNMMEQIVQEKDGDQEFHHEIINQLANNMTVHNVDAGAEGWQEIDRPEDIESWNG